MLDILELSSRHQARSLTPQNLAQIFLAIGNLCERDSALVELVEQPQLNGEVKRLIAIARRQISAFDERNTAETLRGLVFLGRGGETLADALLARASGMIENFPPADLVTALGAVRLIEFDTDHFRSVVAAAVVASANHFNDLELALGALYLADLGLPQPATELVERMMGRLERTDIKHLGILAGAMRRLPGLPDGYCFALADEFAHRLASEPEGVTAREALQVLDLLGKRELRHGPFIEGFCREFRGRVENFSVDDLRDTARGLAILQEGNTEFFRAIGEKALREIHQLKPTDISFLAWSFSSLGIRNDALFNRLATKMEGLYGDLSAITAANIAWSFVPLDNPLARSVVAQAGRAFRAQQHEVMHARQLHIAEVAVGLVAPGNCAPEIAAQVREEIGAGVMNRFEAEIYEAIRKLGIAGLAIRPFEVVEGLVPDFVVSWGDRKIIVECDGARYHLTAQGTRTGRDMIQDQVFRRCGYEVVHILDTQWQALSFGERREFLRRQLGLELYH